MPQLDFFIFFDSALTAGFVFLAIHVLVVFYLLPIWLRGRVVERVLLFGSKSSVTLWRLKEQYRR